MLLSDSLKNPYYVDRFKLALIAFIANIGSLLFGFDFGITSFVLIDINYYANNSNYSNDIYYSITSNSSFLKGLIASGSSIGAMFTYIFLLFFGNSISKKDEIMLASMLFFIGALLDSSSAKIPWDTYWGLVVLIIGRLVYGAGIATSFHSVPQYISEIAPAELRGTIGSLTEAMVVSGVVLGYIISDISYESNGWSDIYIIGYIIALIMGCLAMMTPHSPTWMARHHHSTQDILDSLHFIYPNANDDNVVLLRKSIEHERLENLKMEAKWRNTYHNSNIDSDSDESIWIQIPSELRFLLFDIKLRRCLIFAIILVIFQMGTGQTAILYFAGDIFEEICSTNRDICILGVGISKLVAALSMTLLADTYGRRFFLIYGTIGMIIGLFVLCIGLYYNNTISSLVGIYIAVGGYEIGFGSMLWVLLNEIFPGYVRSAANSIAVATLFAFSTIFTFILPYFEEDIGLLGMFLFFMFVSILAVLLMYLFAPETRGIDLEIAYKLVNSTFISTMRHLGCYINDYHDDDDDILLQEDNTDNNDTTMLLV